MVRFFDPLLEEKKNLYQLHLSMEWNFALTVHKGIFVVYYWRIKNQLSSKVL
jgi:hypothetical protein